MWGCRMSVEMLIDPWKPGVKRYWTETFCYGPKSCRLYKAGPTRKVPVVGAWSTKRKIGWMRRRPLTVGKTTRPLGVPRPLGGKREAVVESGKMRPQPGLRWLVVVVRDQDEIHRKLRAALSDDAFVRVIFDRRGDGA